MRLPMLPVVFALAIADVAAQSPASTDYGVDPALAREQIAVIRPAREDEKLAPAMSLGKRMLTGQAGPGLAILKGIVADGQAPMALKGVDAVRVMPGRFDVTVRCSKAGFLRSFNVPVAASAGDEIIIECVGEHARAFDAMARRK